MKIAVIPEEEDSRLKALYSYQILDSGSESEFDEIVKIASYVCQTPVALISLVDGKRQWFKAKVGLKATETPRDYAFCAHAILKKETFIVPDATKDQRFYDNPLVTGEPHVCFYAGSPLRTASGQQIGTLCVIDHQKRELTKEQLEILESLSRQVVNLLELRLQNESIVRSSHLIQSSPAAIFCKDYVSGEGVFVDWNSAAESLWGLKKEDVLGKTDYNFFPKDQADFFREKDLITLKQNKKLTIDSEPIDTPRGRLILKTWKVPVENRNGKPRYILGISIDITKQIELELDVSRAREKAEATAKTLDLALEGASLGIWDWYLETNEVKFDRRWCEMLGLDFDQTPMELDTWKKRVHPDDIDACYRDIDAYFNKKTHRYENVHRMKHVNGEWIYILDRGRFSAFDQNGKPIRFTGTHLDITLFEKSKRLAEESREKAIAAVKEKTAFFANISHEIRTPIFGVIGNTELLRHTNLTEEQNEMVSVIEESSKTLVSLIDDILDFSKIEAGKLDLTARPFNLRKSVYDAVRIVASRAHEKGLFLEIEIDENVPEVLVSDDTRLRQIFLNLLTNSIKFTEKGGIQITIVRASGPPPLLIISVKDTGIGIATENMDKLFKEFSQVDISTTRRFGGTGLGLAICKHLSEMLGGGIDVESQVGVGSTFTFHISYAESTGLPAINTKSSPAMYEDFSRLGLQHPLRILVAEDNSTNQTLARNFFKKIGYDVEIAPNGLDAFHKLCNEPYDIVVMDIQMPMMDGYEATKKIRSSSDVKKQPYIMALTASATKHDHISCEKAGMNDFLTKPLNIQSLAHAIQRYLKNSSPIQLDKEIETNTEIDSILKKFDNDFEIFSIVAKVFIGDFENHIIGIRNALATKNQKALEISAHTLKGAASNFSVELVVPRAAEIESLARQGQFSNIEGILPHLIYESETLKKKLLALLDQSRESAA